MANARCERLFGGDAAHAEVFVSDENLTPFPAVEGPWGRLSRGATLLGAPRQTLRQATGQEAVRQGTTASTWPLAPFATLTLRIEGRG
ncbi:hypothetical protein ACIQMO_18280 [Streptomyces sp. NPDC091406]|uniref:hypothetical protein n=1 Tax=unclassified Streptomyces TaxID=2593676 RepID=UPI003808E057